MSRNKIVKEESKLTKAEEPVVVYGKKRITFSTVETQNDIQLKYAMSITPVERLQLMRKLNDYAFKNIAPEKILTNPVKLIFTSYEYISG